MSDQKAQEDTVKVFISYSRKDKDLMEELLTHLKVLTRSNPHLEIWYDGLLEPGVLWDDTIKKKLHSAHIVLLLISANFLITDYIWNIEVQSTLEKQQKGELTAIPVIMKACDWEPTPIGRFQAIPRKGMTISSFPDRDEGLSLVVKEIKSVIEVWSKKIKSSV
jgi:hypothetical protein